MSKNRIDITEQEAIDLKENITEEEKDLLKNAVKKEIRKKHRKKTKYMKAAAVAACVLIVAPTTNLWKRNSEIFPEQMETEYFPNGSSGNKGEEVKTKCIFGYTQFKTV